VNELIVPRRFCGPPDSGNGGWTAGALAALDDADSPDDHCDGWPAIEVTLRQPPPLDTPLRVTAADGVLSAGFGGATIATARRAERRLMAVDPVPRDVAAAAEASSPGLRQHPFPTCFVCGTSREEGDGLRIFPGRTGAGPSGDLTERLMVLGRMTARIDDLPVIGEPHVVVGEGRGQDGRKTHTASTLYDADGRVVATAEHTWIAVDPELFGGVAPAR
jgi:hypothetical protein